MRINLKSEVLIIFLLTLAGAILRFWNLSWGSPYFFHPDERNIASAIANLHFPEHLNPHFFAYGSFPIYLTSLITALLSFISNHNLNNFEGYILAGRGISATFSTLMIPLVYLIARELSRELLKVRGKLVPLLASILVTFSPGLIQSAHFSTFETILTFQYLLITYLALKVWQNGNLKYYLLTGLVLGLSIATKITSIAIIPVLLLTHWFRNSRLTNPATWPNVQSNTLIIYIIKVIRPLLVFWEPKFLLALLITGLIALGTSPYNLLDYSAFRSAINYEGDVATGSLPVFYTASFLKTTPLVYQFLHVFPFLISWPLTILGFLAFFLLIFFTSKRLLPTLIFLALPLLYFAFHAPLSVKWTRYMVPLIPYLVILVPLAFSSLNSWLDQSRDDNSKIKMQNAKLQLKIQNFKHLIFLFTFSFLLFHSILLGLDFLRIYLEKDTRIAAAEWASANLPAETKILSEVWDLGIVPFNDKFPLENIKLFNFYELDSKPQLKVTRFNLEQNDERVKELSDLLEWSDVIVLPSRRIWATRLRLPSEFPNGYNFYQKLFAGELGFVKIASFKVRDESQAEETFEVFDHPEVIIFKKIKVLNQDQYNEKISARS